MGIGDFIRGRTYRAIFNGVKQHIQVEHPDTLVPVPVDRLYFDRKQELNMMDDRDAPMSPTFEEQTTNDASIQEESTFVHKSATRKTQEVHEENDGTANLRKYRFNPEA